VEIESFIWNGKELVEILSRTVFAAATAKEMPLSPTVFSSELRGLFAAGLS
jgi:hypothetical protein